MKMARFRYSSVFMFVIPLALVLAGCARSTHKFGIQEGPSLIMSKALVGNHLQPAALVPQVYTTSLQSWDTLSPVVPEAYSSETAKFPSHPAPSGAGSGASASLKRTKSGRSMAPNTSGKDTAEHSIMIVGDSLSVGVGTAMASALKGRQDVAVVPKGKTSTGLNSPKYFDWPSKLALFLDQEQPEILVVMMGGNDAHNGSGSQAWAEDYREKVRGFLKITSNRNIRIFWAGLPPMENPSFSKKVKLANAVMKEACEEYGHCTYIDTWQVTAGEDNEFTACKSVNGKKVKVRVSDGCHFTFTGYKLISKHILTQIAKRGEELDINLE